MERFSEVSQHPRLVQLDQLVEQHGALLAAIEADNFAEASVKDQYEQALHGVRARVDEVLIDGSAVQELERIRTKSEAAKEQLENLAEIMGDIADPELVAEHNSRIVMVTWALGAKATEQAIDDSEVTETTPELTSVEERVVIEPAQIVAPKQSVSTETVERAASPEQEAASKYPLNLRDMAFIARRTEEVDMRKAMAYYDVPRPRLALIEDVKEAAKAAGLRGASSPQKVSEERLDAWKRLEVLLGDEDALLDVIDATEEMSTEVRFLEYLSDLSPESKAKIIELFAAQPRWEKGSFDLWNSKTQEVLWSPEWPQPEYVEYRTSETNVTVVEDIDNEPKVFDQAAVVDEKVEAEEAIEEDHEDDFEDEVIESPAEPEVAIPETATPTPTPTANADVISIDERREKKQHNIPKAFSIFLDRFNPLCESFNEHCELYKDATFSHAQLVAFPGITGRMVSEALTAGVLSVREGRQAGHQFTVRDLFLVWTWDKTKSNSLSLKGKGRPSKMLKELIDERVENLPTLSNQRASRR